MSRPRILRIGGLAVPWYVYLLGLLVLGLTYLPLLMKEEILDAFVREDRIFESLSAIYLFISSVLFVVAWFRYKKAPRPENHTWLRQLSYLGLALILFVSAGEEISWGQRILGFESPEIIKDINVQDEVTIHNLSVFQGEDSVLPLRPSQVFIGFTLGFGLIIPMATQLLGPAGRFFKPIVPIVPLPIGILFGANYLFQKLILIFLIRFPDLYLHPTMPVAQGVHEIREHGYALVWMLAATCMAFVMPASTREARK